MLIFLIADIFAMCYKTVFFGIKTTFLQMLRIIKKQVKHLYIKKLKLKVKEFFSQFIICDFKFTWKLTQINCALPLLI